MKAAAEFRDDTTWLALSNDVLSLSAAAEFVTNPRCGAIATFSGTTRDNFDPGDGGGPRAVVRLEYEAYVPMALRELQRTAAAVRDHFDDIRGIACFHRLGAVPPAESSVIIAVASPHRQAALAACAEFIDVLKARVPIWKREVLADRSVWKENREFFSRPPQKGACSCKALTLELEDQAASWWRFCAEGGAHIVLRATDQCPETLRGFVLRLLKCTKRNLQRSVKLDPSSPEARFRAVLAECGRWSTDATVPLEHFHPRVKSVLEDTGALLPRGKPARASSTFLNEVLREIRPLREQRRLDVPGADQCESACTLEPNAALLACLPSGCVGPTICIEIKPKWGFLPHGPWVTRSVKRTVSRFRMHQQLKCRLGERARESAYDPLDFFSGEPARVSVALDALAQEPQNNLRIFVNSEVMFAAEIGDQGCASFADALEAAALRARSDELAARAREVAPQCVRHLAESHAVRGILALQHLDSIDIEGVMHVWHRFHELLAKGEPPGGVGAAAPPRSRADVAALSLRGCAEILDDFLIATAAKDCSLMISIAIRNDGSYHIAEAIVDLDRKLFENVPEYDRRDREIVAAFEESKSCDRDSSPIPQTMK